MTISSQDARTGPYNGNGSTTEFAYDFKVIDQAHLVVTLKDSSDVETVQTITTHYTVAGVGDAGGGTITMVTPPASGETLTLSRAVPLTQEVDLANRGGVQPEVLETAYDKLTQALQDQEELHARVPRFPVSSSLTNVELPLTLTAGAALQVNSTGDGFENGPTADEITAAQAYSAAAEAALDEFTDLYLGKKTSDPALDNDGAALQDGALYFDTTNNVMKVYDLGTTTWLRTTPTSGDQANINTVTGIAANVTTVAGIASNVTTVAGIASDVSVVAADGADIGVVAADLGGSDTVGTVAGIASDVSTVAAINADVSAVAADATDIGTVAGISANVTTVAGISANVTTVAGISSDVTTVAADGTDIGTVATDIANVNTVAGISGNVTTVAGISSNVTTVAGVSSDVTTVANVASDVTTVAGISGDVASVAAQVVGYAFSTTTTMADPGSGTVRFNNASVSSVTAIAIDDLDSNGVDQSPYIALWDDSTNTVKGTLVFRTSGSDVATFNITGLTDNAGWFELAVTHVASSGTFSNAEDTYIGFTRAGDKGVDGAGSGDVSGPGSSTDNAIVRWDSTSGQLVQDSGVTISDAGAITATAGGSLTGTWSDLGSVTTVDINGGTIDGSTIGAAVAAAGNFTNIDFTGNLTQSGSPFTSGGGYFKGENGTIGSNAGDIFRVNEQELNTDVTIASTENASATGPLSVASGTTLTVDGNLSII